MIEIEVYEPYSCERERLFFPVIPNIGDVIDCHMLRELVGIGYGEGTQEDDSKPVYEVFGSQFIFNENGTFRYVMIYVKTNEDDL